MYMLSKTPRSYLTTENIFTMYKEYLLKEMKESFSNPINRKQKCNISPPEQKLNCKLTTILTLTRTGQTEVTFELKLKRMMCFW